MIYLRFHHQYLKTEIRTILNRIMPELNNLIFTLKYTGVDKKGIFSLFAACIGVLAPRVLRTIFLTHIINIRNYEKSQSISQQKLQKILNFTINIHIKVYIKKLLTSFY